MSSENSIDSNRCVGNSATLSVLSSSSPSSSFSCSSSSPSNGGEETNINSDTGVAARSTRPSVENVDDFLYDDILGGALDENDDDEFANPDSNGTSKGENKVCIVDVVAHNVKANQSISSDLAPTPAAWVGVWQ